MSPVFCDHLRKSSHPHFQNLNREIQGEETHLNALRGKYKSLAPDLNSQERQQTENVLNKIEVRNFIYFLKLILIFRVNLHNYKIKLKNEKNV